MSNETVNQEEIIDRLPKLTAEEEGNILLVLQQGEFYKIDTDRPQFTTVIQTSPNIEVTGMPRAFKTTCLKQSVHLLSTQGLEVGLIEEPTIGFENRRDLLTYALIMAHRTAEALLTKKLNDNQNPIFVDRGVYNLLPFIRNALEKGLINLGDVTRITEYFGYYFGNLVGSLVVCDATPKVSLGRDPRYETSKMKWPVMNLQTLTRLRSYFSELPFSIIPLRGTGTLLNTPFVIARLDSNQDFAIYSDLFTRTLNTLLAFSNGRTRALTHLPDHKLFLASNRS